MNKLVLTRKRWFQLFDVQLLIALAVSVTRLFATKAAPAAVAQVVWEVVIIALTTYVQFSHRPNKIVAVIDRWVCLLFASQILLALAALHTYHGVIAAFAILIIACFLGQAWGYQVNPNLKFGKSSHFQKSVFMILIAFAVLDLVYNSFNDAGKQIWTVLYLYSGKLWLPMLFHFLTDYFANIQSGWNSAGWTFNGTAADYLEEFVIVAVPLAVSIWFMFGKRRQVLEENADRLLKIS